MDITAADFTVLDFIRENLSCGILDALMTAISFTGEAGMIWILLSVLLMIFPKTRKAGLCSALALIMCLIVGNCTLKPIIARPRPFVQREWIELIISPPGEYSFPSGHTMSSFAAAAAIFVHNRRIGSAALVYAALMGFSRLYLYVHFPTDVLGGMIIGAACGVLSAVIVRAFVKTQFAQRIKFFQGTENR